MVPTGFATVTGSRVELADDPIEPSWVLSGDPKARSALWARSLDATTSSHVWECTAGRFRWYFPVDETALIIEGSVTVALGDQEPFTLGAGDAALFPAGTWTVWDVPDYVRKHAILRSPLPQPAALALRSYNKLRQKLGRDRSVGGMA